MKYLKTLESKIDNKVCKQEELFKDIGFKKEYNGLVYRNYELDKLDIKIDGECNVLTKLECDTPCKTTNKTWVKVNGVYLLETTGIHYKIISDFVDEMLEFIGNLREDHDVVLEIKNTDEIVIGFKLSKVVHDGPKYTTIGCLAWRPDMEKLGEVKIVPLAPNFDGVGVPYDYMHGDMLDRIALQGGIVNSPVLFKINAIVEQQKENVLYRGNPTPIEEDKTDTKVYINIK